MSHHRASPSSRPKYKAWLERIGPELWGAIAKADYKQIMAEEAAAKQAEAKKWIEGQEQSRRTKGVERRSAFGLFETFPEKGTSQYDARWALLPTGKQRLAEANSAEPTARHSIHSTGR
jgi:hypothetical protein